MKLSINCCNISDSPLGLFVAPTCQHRTDQLTDVRRHENRLIVNYI